MSYQSEQALEDALMVQLQGLGYELVSLSDERELLANLKRQLERHNQVQLSDLEFERVLNHLNKGNVFDRAHTLRDRFLIVREGQENVYLEFLNLEHWCQNQYQVTRQVSMEGSYKNRYDVTILINGLPLVHIELKRRGMELREAFNQVNRYQRHSFGSGFGLYQYVQLFVISNGVNTKYYANNRRQQFEHTFFWTDAHNKRIDQLDAFTEVFLEKCHLSKMICKYIVLHQSDKILMVLRPYQYYAVEALVDCVRNSRQNGYVWHTTGSGKTLTSFKASQILMKLPEVHKVVFVVDRNDLDYQTSREFNHFQEGCVDNTTNTRTLIEQLAGEHKLIVTTLQKLNTAIRKDYHKQRLEHLRDKRVVFIFDECHRSQFGETHNRIKQFFEQSQLFGFTGTPIFSDNAQTNAQGKRTTRDLFERRLHEYVITNAIADHNVLRFSVEYVGRYRQKEGSEVELDIEVEDIDTRELLDSPERLSKIVDYIIAHHDRKTHHRQFSAIFCVSSVDALIRYYDLFRAKRQAGLHDLRVVTIFSYRPNEDDPDADGGLDGEEAEAGVTPHTREKLDEFIAEYNALYQTKYSTRRSEDFYGYYKDIAKRMKTRERDDFRDEDRADILLVVNMFLTGFDAKKINTLYVDKNLRHHGLVQAFSRTNRIGPERKSHGNIVCFRNLKPATDEAIALFSNPQAREIILQEPFEVYEQRFVEAAARLLELVPSVEAVSELRSEEELLKFVQAFRDLAQLRNTLSTFAQYDADALPIDAQTFEDFKSKYLDIHDRVRRERSKEKVSILEELDFQLELIHRDEINVDYIMGLLAQLHQAPEAEKEQRQKNIIDLLNSEVQLRSKRELIERFIQENLPKIPQAEDVPEAFQRYKAELATLELEQFCKEERLDPERFRQLVADYRFTGHEPLRNRIIDALQFQPRVLERSPIIERIRTRLREWLETFEG